MDPLARVACDEEGHLAIGGGHVRLHYELYRPRSAGAGGSAPRRRPLLIVMGAFATKAHFASTARHIADAGGYEVCLYDHRGTGRSGPPRLEPHTAALLAADGLAVIDALWGPDSAVHVYGASMGGMVAQELAQLLLAAPRPRLVSLGLAITCRGMKPLGGLLSPIFTPRVLKAALSMWFAGSRASLVRRLMRLVLDRRMLEDTHPCGRSYGQVYFCEWLAGFEQLWSLADHTAGACHVHVVLHHLTSKRGIALIRDSGVPLLCQVATRDRLIPPQLQLQLAEALRARVVAFPTGHMGLMPWQAKFHGMLLEHLAMGEATHALAEAAWAREAAGALKTQAPPPAKPLVAALLSCGSAHSSLEGASSLIGTALLPGASSTSSSSELDDA